MTKALALLVLSVLATVSLAAAVPFTPTRTVDHPQGILSRVDDVLITAELARRSSRPPNFEAENRALTTLVQEMAVNPGGVLEKLVRLPEN